MQAQLAMTALRSRSTAIYAALAVLVLLLALALRVPSFYEPRWYADEGIFAAIAQNMREGRTLYAEAWDNKPPLIFVTYALIQYVFGAGVLPLHAVTAVVVLATQAGVMAIALRLYGGWRSLAAGLAFALVMCTPIIEGNLALTETYMILPVTLAVLVFVLAQDRGIKQRDRWYAAAGVLASLAISYKQVAIFDAAAIGTMIWLTHERPFRSLAPFAAGVVAPQLALLALFTALGALSEYTYAMVGSAGVYADLGDKSPIVRVSGYLPALLVVAYLERRQRLGGDVGVRHFPMLWLAFAIAGATSSPFEFPHYLQQAAPAAALLLVSSPLPVERDDLGRIALVVTGLLVVAIVFGQYATVMRERRQLHPLRYYETFVSRERGDVSELDYMYEFDGSAVAVKDIAGYIREDGAGDTLFAWSELAWVYPAAGVTNPARYYASFFGELIPDAKEDIMRDLRASPPTYIVMSDAAYAPFLELEDFVAGRYDLLRAQGDWQLYRLSTANGRLTPQESGAALRR
jgi:hypothetical protein